MIEPKLTVSDGRTHYIEIDNRHIEAIAHEYWAAKEKHPKLCDYMIDPATDWKRLEQMMKNRNDESAPPYFGENILLEEVAEAMNAYRNGDREDCLHELAQCGAVIFRLMEFVEFEGQKENE